MINISKLYCEEVTPGDWLRYGMKGSGERPGETVPEKASERRPIVVWNITRNCNLKCVHCYNDSGTGKTCNDATTEEAKAVIDDLAAFGVPSVLFSGGEPLMRHDLFGLIGYAGDKGLRTVISTNGTLITKETAKTIKDRGVSYVGISLDGIGEINDKFRGVDGAFERAVAGIKNCQDAGVRIGLRLTLTKRNVEDITALFDFFDTNNIERACFYHLVPSGKGIQGSRQEDGYPHRRQPCRRRVSLSQAARRRPGKGRKRLETPDMERRRAQQQRCGYRLHRLQRKGPPRPVLGTL